MANDQNTEITNIDELLLSERYEKSNYELVQINGEFALRIKGSNEYRGISSDYNWTMPQHVRNHALGSIDEIISLFNKEVKNERIRKEIEEPLIVKSVNASNEPKLTTIETYKQKLMKGLE